MAITDGEYPDRVAFWILHEALQSFNAQVKPSDWEAVNKDTDKTFKFLEDLIKKWQNPAEHDKLFQIEKELNEITDIMKKNLNEILRKGESLDRLLEKSKDLNQVSVGFYKKAKDNNSCCKTG